MRLPLTSVSDKGIELSIVMPCYNEEKVLPLSIPPLLDLCNELNLRYEVILVNNGSWDSTPQVIDSFISQGYPIRRVDVAVNQGAGWGIICGLKEAKGKYVAYMCADGQISAEDVIRAYWAIRKTKRGVIAKVWRINRADGCLRRSLSWIFNLLFRILYGRTTQDVNGTPKIFHREDLQVLEPGYKDSFIDSELMIKAKALHFKIIEVPAIFHKRLAGDSTVRVLQESFEFLRNLILFRWNRNFQDWYRKYSITERREDD